MGESFGWLIPQNVVALPNREICHEPCSIELGMCRAIGMHCVSENGHLSPRSCSKYLYTGGCIYNVCYALLD